MVLSFHTFKHVFYVKASSNMSDPGFFGEYITLQFKKNNI